MFEALGAILVTMRRSNLSKLVAIVSRGRHLGKELFPHKHADGQFVASHTRFEQDYIRTESIHELHALINAGYGTRMSNPTLAMAPSLKTSDKIRGRDSSVTVRVALIGVTKDLDLDGDSLAKTRKEQAFLRAHLLGGEVDGECIICQRELPEALLVAAHLKKRAKCATAERRDFDNVAALMCKLGCDSLYENGFIVVRLGQIAVNAKRSGTAVVQEIVENLVGNTVANWSASKPYYEWHEDQWT